MGRIWFLNFQLSNSHYSLISILWPQHTYCGMHTLFILDLKTTTTTFLKKHYLTLLQLQQDKGAFLR